VVILDHPIGNHTLIRLYMCLCCRMLYELGFDISNTGFAGPFLSRDVIYDPNAPQPSWDVFGVRRTT
jgi:hypothetical protein